MLSLRCRLLQYAVFVGINGWHGNNIFLYIFCFIFQINLFFRCHVYFLRLQCIIKQLADSVFVICKIINVSVRVICLAFGSADNSYLELIIPHITKTSSSYCLIYTVLNCSYVALIDRSRIYCSPSLVTVATSDKLKFVFDIQRGKNPDC